MAIHNEIEFEMDICQHLQAHGWLYSPTDDGYDRELALIPEDVLAWIKETQSTTWEKFAAYHGTTAETEFISRLSKCLATDGTLSVLRNGIKVTGAGSSTFQLVQYKPAFGFNQEIAAKYQAVRLRVMRQVHYSLKNQNSIDLVLFVNGLPVATVEIKTDFTQGIEDAKEQYKTARDPKSEPLLTFKRGALVHFAVSSSEVWMTTKLEGPSTYFLPFNQGNNGQKGNPPNPNGYPTAYLWERIWERDNWLRILGSFIELEIKKEKDASGKKVIKESIIFPRYHQWEAVTKLTSSVKTGGTQKYLFQHSAGSGKSNTIGWCAHQLSTLHDEHDQKLFDSVIVITDRTILDEQLKDTVSQFGQTPGVVATIDNATGSKSGTLAAALKKGAMIIVVTLQTFPFVLSELREGKGMATRKFAVLIDEAHSSQSGSAARKLKSVLTSTGDAEDEDEATVEDLLIQESATRRLPPNTIFIAFTATPKSKTLEIFGTLPDVTKPLSKTNLPVPFHLYKMRQAIDEGFILDVLQNYLPYKVAYKLAHNGKDWDDKVVEKSEGMKALARWVQLHPHNIDQKVEVIVEHFRQNVAHLLDGKAKAMVVTSSRQEAVRYKLSMDKYIAISKYTNFATLVAFSGEVIDTKSGPDKFTEGSMNTDLKRQSIREGFKTPGYQVLIVANKFQTGFDQPLLCAMYVDKRLDGISAVQTLSRLNRMDQGKKITYVLDFRNDTETIRKAFEPYYEETELLANTDPNLVYDLQSRISAEGIYTEQEASNVAEIVLTFVLGKSRQQHLTAALGPPVDRFKKRWTAAKDDDDKEEIDRLTIFHKNLGAYCRLYDFLSQIVSYDDPTLETCYILYKHLEPLVRPQRVTHGIDLSEVVLTHYKLKPPGGIATPVTIGLGMAVHEEKTLKPLTAVGTQAAQDPEQVRLEELIQRLNDLFADETLTDADAVGLFNHVAAKLMESQDIQQQVMANTRQQFLQSPTFADQGKKASIAAMDNYENMGKKLFGNKDKMAQFLTLLASHIYDEVHRNQAQA